MLLRFPSSREADSLMKTLASDSVRDGECLHVYPRDGLCSVVLIDHDMVGRCYLH